VCGWAFGSGQKSLWELDVQCMVHWCNSTSNSAQPGASGRLQVSELVWAGPAWSAAVYRHGRLQSCPTLHKVQHGVAYIMA
jgi:hypothetical protein